MKRIFLVSLFVVMAGCGSNNGTSTGNPLVNISMASSGSAATVAKTFFHKLFTLLVPQSVAKAPPPTMKDANNNDVSITDYWVSLGEIEFKYSETVESGEVDGSEVEFAGPFTVNMFSSSPDLLASGTLVSSDFRRIKYKFNKVNALPSGAPAGLLNKAIYIAGTVNGKPFTFTTTSEIQMMVAGANLVGAQNGDTLLLQIKIANLVKKIDFSAITSVSNTPVDEGNRLPSGGASLCPTIDSSLTDVYTCLMSGFSTEGNLGKDLNGDGEFQDSEPTVK